MYIYIYIYIYMYIYIYIYIYTHTLYHITPHPLILEIFLESHWNVLGNYFFVGAAFSSIYIYIYIYTHIDIYIYIYI